MFDGLIVVGIALFTSVLSEGIVWWTTYRTTRYKGMKAALEAGAKKLEKLKHDSQYVNDQKASKRIEKEENRLKEAHKELQGCKSKSTLVVAVLMIVIMTTLNRKYAGYTKFL